MECKSPTSQPSKRAIRPSKSARIFSAASFLSTAYHQSVVLQPDEDRPNAPMVYGYGVSKCDSVRREVFFYASEGGGRDGAKQEDGRVVLADEIGLGG